MRRVVILITILIFQLSASAIIQIPTDYPTIQEGIDHAASGDTLLVLSGIYEETLEIHQIDVMLASQFLMTGDTAHVSSTILDGNFVRQILYGYGPCTIEIVGLTFRRGTSSEPEIAGAITALDSTTIRVRDSRFHENRAFGFGFCGIYGHIGAVLDIQDCEFAYTNNSVRGTHVRGFGATSITIRRSKFHSNISEKAKFISGSAYDRYLIDSCEFRDNLVTGHMSDTKALVGVASDHSEITHCTIRNNILHDATGLIRVGSTLSDSITVQVTDCVIDSNVLFDAVDGYRAIEIDGMTEYIYLNNIHITNNTYIDSERGKPGIGAIPYVQLIADSIFIQNNFTSYDELGSRGSVCYLGPTSADGADPDTCFISNIFIENNEYRRTDLDVYPISPSEGNLGLSTRGDAVVNNLVVVNNVNDMTYGYYSSLGIFINNEYGRTVALRNVLIHDNDWRYWVNTMGENRGSAINQSFQGSLAKILLDNVTIYNQFSEDAAVVQLEADSVIINNLDMHNCGHGAMDLRGDYVRLSNSQIHDCFDMSYDEFWHPHANVVFINASESMQLINCNLVDCEVEHGETLVLGSDGTGEVLNCIVENTSTGWPAIDVSGVSVRYSDVIGGYPGEGNIDADPLFTDPENDNYTLQPDSPCIDAGLPDERFNDPEDPWNEGFALWPAMGTLRNDMGVYGGSGDYPSLEGVRTRDVVPEEIILHQNYPNPFNPTTTITFTLPHPEEITLSVFNILGEMIAMPADGMFSAGEHRVEFDGSGLASGVYLYRLDAGGGVLTRKMVLVR